MPSLTGLAWGAATTAAAPVLRVMLRRRAARGREIAARLPEREGIEAAPRPPGRLLWLHAASVGEAVSALPVIAALPEGLSVLFTTGTLTSATLLAERLPALAPRVVLHRFVPLDVPAWAGRFLDHWRPNAACFLESELWPNLLAACRARDIPLALINARLSARSAKAWGHLPAFAGEVLGGFALVAARSEEDAARLRRLGARHVKADGDLKLAAASLPCDQAALAPLKAQLGERPRLLAASTHPGEEAMMARVHHTLSARHPGLLTAIVPRHPERGAALARALPAPNRSAGLGPPPGGLWLADTLGELGLLYRLFPIVFMGKSLAGTAGGQNPLEPARLGCAVATGPAHDNFDDAVRLLSAAGALAVVEDEHALAAWADRMLADPALLSKTAKAALAASAGDLAAVARIASRIASRLADLAK